MNKFRANDKFENGKMFQVEMIDKEDRMIDKDRMID